MWPESVTRVIRCGCESAVSVGHLKYGTRHDVKGSLKSERNNGQGNLPGAAGQEKSILPKTRPAAPGQVERLVIQLFVATFEILLDFVREFE